MKDRETISVIVLTYNNESIIKDFLQSVQWADEIVVVDSGSTDRTKKICLQAHANLVFVTRRLDSFAKQRNFGIDQASEDWVFHCDSDENFTPELAQEVLEMLTQAKRDPGNLPFEAWNAPQSFFWFDRPTSFINGPSGFNVKCHRRGLCRFQGSVHERIEYGGPVGLFRAPILHITRLSIDKIIDKYKDYSDKQAHAALRGEIKLPEGMSPMVYRALKRFLGFILIKRAFKDGMPGVIWAALQTISLLLTYSKLWALRNGEWRLVNKEISPAGKPEAIQRPASPPLKQTEGAA